MTKRRIMPCSSWGLAACFAFLLCELLSWSTELQTSDLRGVVLSSKGHRLQDSRVHLLQDRFIFHSLLTTKTDSDGEFHFSSVPSGEYVLAFGPHLEGKRIFVGPKDEVFVRCKIESSEMKFSGHVSFSGKPIDNHRMLFIPLSYSPGRVVYPPPIQSSEIENGVYNLDSLLPGKYLIRITKSVVSADKPRSKNQIDVQFSSIVSIQKKQSRLDIQVPDNTLSGSLSNCETQPPFNLHVLLVPADLEPWSLPYQMSNAAVVDGSGQFVFRNLQTGRYDLVLTSTRTRSEGFNTGVQLKSNISITEGNNRLKWQLEIPARVDFDIGFDAEPPAETRLFFFSLDHSKVFSLRPHAFRAYSPKEFASMPFWMLQGKYEIYAVPFVHYQSDHYAIGNKTIEVPQDTESMNCSYSLKKAGDLHIHLHGRSTDLAGRIIRIWDKSGKEIRRLRHPLWSYDSRKWSMICLPTDRYGRTSIFSLPKGRYRIRAGDEEEAIWVELDEGEEKVMVIELKAEKPR